MTPEIKKADAAKAANTWTLLSATISSLRIRLSARSTQSQEGCIKRHREGRCLNVLQSVQQESRRCVWWNGTNAMVSEQIDRIAPPRVRLSIRVRLHFPPRDFAIACA
jgi:hypothetical protein